MVGSRNEGEEKYRMALKKKRKCQGMTTLERRIKLKKGSRK